MSFVTSLSGGDGVRVEETLGNGYVRLRVSEAERRQAKHDIRCVEDAVIELLRNSRDAGATHMFVATAKEDAMRSIVILDDGSGIPQNMHKRIFDARVTSKLDSMHVDKWGVHGRGMALYSIHETAVEAKVLASRIGLGTVLRVVFDTSQVKERADQSTWPSVSMSGEHDLLVKGPINIARVCVEFAYESRRGCRVFLGSPSQIVATLRKHGARMLASGYEHDEIDLLPYVDRVAMATEARMLSAIARSFGLEMSERTAHRIIKDEIKPVPNVLSSVMASEAGALRPQMHDSGLGARLTKDERNQIAERVRQCVDPILNRYYLSACEVPTVRVSKDKIVVSIPFDEGDVQSR